MAYIPNSEADYRMFITNHSSIVKPLTDLTSQKRAKTIQWTPDCETAMNTLKCALSSSLVLAAPDFTRRFIVQTDVSTYGIGAGES